MPVELADRNKRSVDFSNFVTIESDDSIDPTTTQSQLTINIL
jgi:hypothetical protein